MSGKIQMIKNEKSMKNVKTERKSLGIRLILA